MLFDIITSQLASRLVVVVVVVTSTSSSRFFFYFFAVSWGSSNIARIDDACGDVCVKKS